MENAAKERMVAFALLSAALADMNGTLIPMQVTWKLVHGSTQNRASLMKRHTIAAKGDNMESNEITNWAAELKIPVSSFSSFENMKFVNERAGYHWFSADTMKFFSCRLLGSVYANWKDETCHLFYFVSSEQRWGSARLYSVRVFDSHTGIVDTIGKFQEHGTSRAAKSAAQRAAKNSSTRSA